ncbi:hypothetical protein [Thermocrinis sp.]|jgi:hypothetical protein|uniref:hypothetical protein n=1 Tax=Thermocrinis sp. TaxID=2024383 RepID=UPI003BFEEB33
MEREKLTKAVELVKKGELEPVFWEDGTAIFGWVNGYSTPFLKTHVSQVEEVVSKERLLEVYRMVRQAKEFEENVMLKKVELREDWEGYRYALFREGRFIVGVPYSWFEDEDMKEWAEKLSQMAEKKKKIRMLREWKEKLSGWVLSALMGEIVRVAGEGYGEGGRGVLYYTLSERVPYEAWEKVKHLFHYYKNPKMRPVESFLHPAMRGIKAPSGYYTTRPEEVKAILKEVAKEYATEEHFEFLKALQEVEV